MRKKLLVLLSAAVLSLAVFGCAAADNDNAASPSPDENTQAADIASDWELVEFTVNGETTTADELDDVADIAPAFTCTDGTSCVISNNGSDHPGTLTLVEDGQYTISFDDTEHDMTAQITGDTLTLTNDTGTVEMVFRSSGN